MSGEDVIEVGIKLNQLRIGNRVHDNISKRAIWVDAVFMSKKHDDDRYSFLRLSKERVKDMGFYECVAGVFVHPVPGLKFRISVNEKMEWKVLVGFVGNEVIDRPIKYVHTVQNLILDIYEVEV